MTALATIQPPAVSPYKTPLALRLAGVGVGVGAVVLPRAGGRRLRSKVTRQRSKPTKGGDGGILGQVELEDARGNRRVVLVSVAASSPGLVETLDAADRAHGVRVWDHELGWLLVCAATEKGRPTPGLAAKPRRYPCSQMTSRGVAFDSAFDLFAERLRRLAGVTLDAGNMADARWRVEPEFRGGRQLPENFDVQRSLSDARGYALDRMGSGGDW